jgi:DNA-binding GntR family transcriptional regulator
VPDPSSPAGGPVVDLAAHLAVDRAAPVPLHQQVAAQLEAVIVSGRLPAGARITTEVALADVLGVSRPTVRAAIGSLVDRGLLVRKRGVGTQVVGVRLDRSLELTSLHDDLVRAGQRVTTTVLAVGEVPAAPEPARALRVAAGTPVLELRRLRCADGEPVALMTNHLPIGMVALDAAALEAHGLYELLRAAGVRIRIADQSVGAAAATAAQARRLGERPGAALVTMTRTAYDDEGRPVEHGSHLYRGSRYRFSTTLVAR